ncbi:hypothetical protein OIY81_3628, partial [Cryptosporidium canis]
KRVLPPIKEEEEEGNVGVEQISQHLPSSSSKSKSKSKLRLTRKGPLSKRRPLSLARMRKPRYPRNDDTESYKEDGGNSGVEQSSQPLASSSSLTPRPPKPKPRGPLTKRKLHSLLMRSKKIVPKGPSEHRGEEDEAPQMQAPQPKPRGPLTKRKLQTLLLRGRSVSVEHLNDEPYRDQNDDNQPENKKYIRRPLTRRKLLRSYIRNSLRKVRRTRRSLHKSASNASREHGSGQKSGRQSSLNVKKQETSGGASSAPLTRSQSHGTGAGTGVSHFPSPAQESPSSESLEAPTNIPGETYRLDPELVRRLGTVKTKRKKLARWHKQ